MSKETFNRLVEQYHIALQNPGEVNLQTLMNDFNTLCKTNHPSEINPLLLALYSAHVRFLYASASDRARSLSVDKLAYEYKLAGVGFAQVAYAVQDRSLYQYAIFAYERARYLYIHGNLPAERRFTQIGDVYIDNGQSVTRRLNQAVHDQGQMPKNCPTSSLTNTDVYHSVKDDMQRRIDPQRSVAEVVPARGLVAEAYPNRGQQQDSFYNNGFSQGDLERPSTAYPGGRAPISQTLEPARAYQGRESFFPRHRQRRPPRLGSTMAQPIPSGFDDSKVPLPSYMRP